MRILRPLNKHLVLCKTPMFEVDSLITLYLLTIKTSVIALYQAAQEQRVKNVFSIKNGGYNHHCTQHSEIRALLGRLCKPQIKPFQTEQ